jgi:hypothetical protein
VEIVTVLKVIVRGGWDNSSHLEQHLYFYLSEVGPCTEECLLWELLPLH